MKALTLWQPWASLIADGHKPFETRHWPPPPSLIGRQMAIHAGKRVERDAAEDFGYAVDLLLPAGEIVCYATLAAAAQVRRVAEDGTLTVYRVRGDWPRTVVKEDRFGDYSPGRWLWYFTNINKLRFPLQVRGHQGIWEFKL